MEFLRSHQTFQTFAKLFVTLSLSSVFSVMLVWFRFVQTHQFTFFYLIWNLFLAWIPFVLSIVFLALDKVHQKIPLIMLGLFAAWLLFFPNAIYIVTDLIHIKTRVGSPLWYDILLVFSFAWNGVILAFISLFIVHDFFEKYFNWMVSWIFIILLMSASSLGVFLGRFLRWNSWDIVTSPLGLARDIFVIFVRPHQDLETTGFIIIYTVFFLFAYYQLRILFKHQPVFTNTSLKRLKNRKK